MKKLTTLAVAAALVAPMSVMANTTLYGLQDWTLTSTETGSADSVLDVQDGNGSSRIGVKGSEDLGNGLKAIFQYEWSTGASLGSDLGSTGGGLAARVARVGLSGGFGTVAIGRQWNPYYFAVGKTNIHDMAGGFDTYAGNFTVGGGYRLGNSVAYSSPNFNGFTFGAIAAMDSALGGAAGDGVDMWAVAAQYNNGPLSVGVGYNDVDDDTSADTDMLGLSAKYNFGNFALMARIEDGDNAGVDTDAFEIGAQAYFGNNTISVSYGEIERGSNDMEEFNIGVRHAFSKRTRVYAEYFTQENDTASADEDKFGIGLRHDF